MNYLNSDDVSHNIHTYAVKNDGLNKTVSGHTNVEQKFEKAETVKVTCDIHPWMASYIVVTDASAWATTGADGSFAIELFETVTQGLPRFANNQLRRDVPWDSLRSISYPKPNEIRALI